MLGVEDTALEIITVIASIVSGKKNWTERYENTAQIIEEKRQIITP